MVIVAGKVLPIILGTASSGQACCTACLALLLLLWQVVIFQAQKGPSAAGSNGGWASTLQCSALECLHSLLGRMGKGE